VSELAFTSIGLGDVCSWFTIPVADMMLNGPIPAIDCHGCYGLERSLPTARYEAGNDASFLLGRHLTGVSRTRASSTWLVSNLGRRRDDVPRAGYGVRFGSDTTGIDAE
jgi:hypothetical protein